MPMSASSGRSSLTQRHRYKQRPEPLVFPVEETVSEGRRHLELRLLVFDSLDLELGHRATVGSDQFVYWNASNPKRCLSPDVFVCLGRWVDDLLTWKTWEQGGVPDVAVEISSPSDTPEGPWQRKLERYAELGIPELVRFRREAPAGQRLQVWDRIEENLLERETGGRAEWSEVLGLWWVVVEHPEFGHALRLSRDPVGQDILPTRLERTRAALEHTQAELEREHATLERAQAELGRKHATVERAQAELERERAARELAEQRLREVEAELAKRRG